MFFLCARGELLTFESLCIVCLIRTKKAKTIHIISCNFISIFCSILGFVRFWFAAHLHFGITWFLFQSKSTKWGKSVNYKSLRMKDRKSNTENCSSYKVLMRKTSKEIHKNYDFNPTYRPVDRTQAAEVRRALRLKLKSCLTSAESKLGQPNWVYETSCTYLWCTDRFVRTPFRRFPGTAELFP